MNDDQLISKFRSLVRDADIKLLFSDEVLLCFIRARKSDLNRALQLLKNYIKMTRNYPDLLTDLKPRRLQKVLECGHVLASPVRDKNGSRIILLKAGHWDVQKCTLEEVFKAIVCCLQRFASESETQKNGVVAVLDFKNFGLQQVRHVTPPFVKKLADLIQEVFPLRFQGIHIVNEPWVFKMILSMIWPFLSTKMRSRFFFHGDCMSTLHQQVGPGCLPSDYNGWLDSVDEMIFTKTIPESDCSNMFDCFN